VESGERKKILEKLRCLNIDHEETVGISNIFAILCYIIDCTKVAEKLTLEVKLDSVSKGLDSAIKAQDIGRPITEYETRLIR